MKKEVVAHKDPKSPISEIFRTLRTNIQFINTNKNIQTLLVTSTLPGEGKSWIASNLAVAFAQTGKKVVLIDADMRKGRQYMIFDTPPTPGLSNYLSQVGMNPKQNNTSDEILDCIQKTEVPNLYLMPAGSIPPNPSELLVSSKMIKVLEKFKQAFDVVIIDGTPCELVTDAVILSRVVESTIIVTAHKVTKKDALERVIKSIQNVGGNLTGVVVNKMPISGKKYERRYYYYGESSNSDKGNETNKKSIEEPPAKKEKNKKIPNTETKPRNIKNEKEEIIESIQEENQKPISIKRKKATETKNQKPISIKRTKTAKQENQKPIQEKKTKAIDKEAKKVIEEETTEVIDKDPKKVVKTKTAKELETEGKKTAKSKDKKETQNKKTTKSKTKKDTQTQTQEDTKSKEKENTEIETKKNTKSKAKKETQNKNTKQAKTTAEKTKKPTKKTKNEVVEKTKTNTKKIEPKEQVSLNKTEDILKKMNEFLEKENSKKEKEEEND